MVGAKGRQGTPLLPAMWEEAVVRSGEVGSLREKRWVGESRLRRSRLKFTSDSVIRVTLASASVHVV